jgi:hypothetical protein
MVDDPSRPERVLQWCAQAGLPADRTGSDRLTVTLDGEVGLTVAIEPGQGDEPLRIHDRLTVAAVDRPGLTADVVEAVVLGRSAMIDGRIAGPDTVETVVAVYPDGLDRHSFMTALFEVQKVRALIRRAVADRAADAVVVAELERLVGESSPT